MAELSTIARPYAEGLWQALCDSKATSAQIDAASQALEALATLAADRQAQELASNPRISDDQFYETARAVLGDDVPPTVANLLRVVIDNERLAALPQIAERFRARRNEAEGKADAYIETAYPLTEKQVKQVLDNLSGHFPGVTLNPMITVNPELIGGVCVRVGDKVIDTSVRARLKQMQAALTA